MDWNRRTKLLKIGTVIETNEPFAIKTPIFLKTHTLLQAITGGGKTGLILKIIEELRSPESVAKYGYIPIVMSDDSGEFLKIPEYYNDFVVLDKKHYGEIFNINDAFELGKKTRQLGISVILKMNDIGDRKDQEFFMAEFIKGFRSVGREDWKPCLLIIDEAELFVPTTSKRKNVASREQLIDACKRAKKENIAILLATQFASDIHIDARRELANRIIGKTVELADRRLVADMLGDRSLVDKLWGLKVGEFYMRGDALSHNLLHVQVDESKIATPDVGIKIKVQDNKIVGDVLKTALSHEGQEPLVISLQRKIDRQTDEITELKENEFTLEWQKKIFDEGYAEALTDSKKGILRKLFRK